MNTTENATKKIDIQSKFLANVRKDNVPVTVFLVNGFQIQGTIKSFDTFTIELESQKKQQLIFKHAISTIVPAHAINLQKTK